MWTEEGKRDRGRTCNGAECPYEFEELNQNSVIIGHGVGWSFCWSPDRRSGPDEHGAREPAGHTCRCPALRHAMAPENLDGITSSANCN